jgi:hypothetical protein
VREAFVLFAVVGCASVAPSPTDPTPAAITPVEVTVPRRPKAAMFGRTDETGRFLRVTEITHADNVVFGWKMDLGCTGPVLYKETMLLPAPGDWTFTPEELPETAISNGGKTATTTDYVACRNGWIEHTWRIAKNDPPGEWIVTIEIEGYEPTVFKPTFVKR